MVSVILWTIAVSPLFELEFLRKLGVLRDRFFRQEIDLMQQDRTVVESIKMAAIATIIIIQIATRPIPRVDLKFDFLITEN